MAVVPSNKLSLFGAETPLAQIALTGADSLMYDALSDQLLFLVNNTGAEAIVNIDGGTGTTTPVSGTGDQFDVAGGKDIIIPDGASVAVRLSAISAYLSGPVLVSGDIGVIAYITTTF
jgi:hypothetical protein